jgi:hypothetical protein
MEGVAQSEDIPNGVAPNGVVPKGVDPSDRASTANFEDLSARDLLAWLQEHASGAQEKYLQDRLQHLCKEVKKMQS